MKKIIIGNTGFVGSNLCKQTTFDAYYNSKNVLEAYNTEPDLCIYAGVRAEKYLANTNESKDLENINAAIENIKNINPKFLVLISTIDVYDDYENHDEDYESTLEKLDPYGKNRLILERWVESNFNNYLIVRLPALFGDGLKKNFIYDYIHVVPFILKENKYNELVIKDPELNNFYSKNINGFYQCKILNDSESELLKSKLLNLNFSAINFTDSRNEFQFYDLNFLWKHITKSIELEIKKINLVTEPILINSLYEKLIQKEFNNHIQAKPTRYNLKTKYDNLFDGECGYIMNKETILDLIIKFIEGYR